MISLLLPSRGRPENVQRLYETALHTAAVPQDIEFVVVLDDDDAITYSHLHLPRVTWITTERTVLSKYWNIAYEHAHGPIFMHCGDDIAFRTFAWDREVNQAFERYPDRIVFVHGYDGTMWDQHEGGFGTHGFLHKNWVDAVGYFVPPYFSSDYNDTWLNEVGHRIGRHERVPILTEHMHPSVGKGPWDGVHEERIQRHRADDCDRLYAETAHLRIEDAEKLMRAMHG